MDNNEAIFILQSFRPDGADSHDPAFAEALKVAAESREVGDWLARERATDAAFAAALGAVEIPEDLRESILAVLAGESAEEFSEMDSAFVGALASVRAPEGLREQILAAMAVEDSIVPLPRSPGLMRQWIRGAAVAAAVVLGAFVAVQVTSSPPKLNGAVTAKNVEQYTIQALGSAGFGLDQENESPVALVNWLKERNVPAPEALPVGLSGVQGIGCKILELNDKKAALICFKLGSGQVVHMVTLDRADIEGALPALAKAKGECHGCKVTGWSSVAWSNKDQAFVMVGKMKPEELAKVF